MHNTSPVQTGVVQSPQSTKNERHRKGVILLQTLLWKVASGGVRVTLRRALVT